MFISNPSLAYSTLSYGPAGNQRGMVTFVNNRIAVLKNHFSIGWSGLRNECETGSRRIKERNLRGEVDSLQRV